MNLEIITTMPAFWYSIAILGTAAMICATILSLKIIKCVEKLGSEAITAYQMTRRWQRLEAQDRPSKGTESPVGKETTWRRANYNWIDHVLRESTGEEEET